MQSPAASSSSSASVEDATVPSCAINIVPYVTPTTAISTPHSHTHSHSYSHSHHPSFVGSHAMSADSHRPRPSGSFPLTLLAEETEEQAHGTLVDTHDIPLPLQHSCYTLISKIGQGGFASVYRAIYIPTGEEVAIKIFDLDMNWHHHMEKEQLEDMIGVHARKHSDGAKQRNMKYRMEDVWKEVTMTQQLRHSNICKYTYCFGTPHIDHGMDYETRRHSSASPPASAFLSPLSAAPPAHRNSLMASPPPMAVQSHPPNHLYIVMPLCEGSVKQMLSLMYPNGMKEDKLIASLLAPIVSVLAYLHSVSNHKVHGDIKVDNILLDKWGRVLVADWGICEDFWTDTSDMDWSSVNEQEDEDEPDSHQTPDISREASRSRSQAPLPSTPTPRRPVPSKAGSFRASKLRSPPHKKFVGTPLMMAPEVLAQASISSMGDHMNQHKDPNASPSSSVGSPTPPLAYTAASGSSRHLPAQRDASLRGFYAENPNPSYHVASSFAAKSDIWSLGILALELAFGSPPHTSQSLDAFHLRRMILDSPAPTVNSTAKEFQSTQTKKDQSFQFSEKFHQFVSACLVKDPLKRASAAQLMKHKFLSKYACTKTSSTPSTTAANNGASAAATPASSPRGSISASSIPPPVSSSTDAASTPLYHPYLCQQLVDPWHASVAQARLRDDRDRKEADRLSKRSMSKAEVSAMKALHQVAQQLQTDKLVE